MNHNLLKTAFQLISLLILGLCGRAVLAVPVNCLNTGCSVTDGNATIFTTNTVEHDLSGFVLNGNNYLSEEEFHLNFGTAIPQEGGDGIKGSFDIARVGGGILSATMDEATNTIVTQYDIGRTTTATVTRKLTSTGPNSAKLIETLEIAHVPTETPQSLWVIEYTNWDLGANKNDDKIVFDGVETFTATDASGLFTASVKSLQSHTSHSAAICCEVLASVGGNLNFSNNAGPGDIDGAFHFNVTFPPNGNTISLSFEKNISDTPSVPTIVARPVPVLSPLGITGLSLLLTMSAFFCFRRKKS